MPESALYRSPRSLQSTIISWEEQAIWDDEGSEDIQLFREASSVDQASSFIDSTTAQALSVAGFQCTSGKRKMLDGREAFLKRARPYRPLQLENQPHAMQNDRITVDDAIEEVDGGNSIFFS